MADNSSRAAMARTVSELGLPLTDVVVLLACNEKFAPYLSVAVQSISEHASPNRRYDVVVLSNDLSPQTMRALHGQATRENFGIGFLNVAAAVRASKLPKQGRFKAEASFRLMAPTLLEGVDKAVYLDSDLVVLHDLAELFDTDLGDNLLGATRDADTAGMYAGYDPCVRAHIDEVVGLSDPYTYFQSGVLLLNLEAMRRLCPADEMLAFTQSHRLRWPDQDVLNHFGRGRYLRLDTRWNVLTDWQRLRRAHIVSQAPQDIRADYDRARNDPYVVHYAGPDGRPWLYPDADMAEHFWRYAERCPFREEILRRLRASKRTPLGLAKRLQVAFIYRVAMPVVDALLPPGTKRRHVVLSTYQHLGGRVA